MPATLYESKKLARNQYLINNGGKKKLLFKQANGAFSEVAFGDTAAGDDEVVTGKWRFEQIPRIAEFTVDLTADPASDKYDNNSNVTVGRDYVPDGNGWWDIEFDSNLSTNAATAWFFLHIGLPETTGAGASGIGIGQRNGAAGIIVDHKGYGPGTGITVNMQNEYLDGSRAAQTAAAVGILGLHTNPYNTMMRLQTNYANNAHAKAMLEILVASPTDPNAALSVNPVQFNWGGGNRGGGIQPAGELVWKGPIIIRPTNTPNPTQTNSVPNWFRTETTGVQPSFATLSAHTGAGAAVASTFDPQLLMYRRTGNTAGTPARVGMRAIGAVGALTIEMAAAMDYAALAAGVTPTYNPHLMAFQDGKIGVFGTNPVAKKTGWTPATGTATRTAFDTATVTLQVLAEHVKALIDDFHSATGYGWITT